MDVAVVTGAGRGLGEKIATRLSAHGLAVVVADVNAEQAEAVAARLGGEAQPMEVDVTRPKALRKLATKASELGRVAVWVNNAGVINTARVWEQDDGAIERMVAVNLGGVIHGSRAAVDLMRVSGGRILNVSSMSALGPTPGLSVYGATKHAVLAFSTSLQVELRQAGLAIEVRSLCPDAIDTQMVRDAAYEPQSALIFSGGNLLNADAVADQAIELLFSKRMRAVLPAWRGVLARLSYLAPRVGMRLYPLLTTVGEWRRKRFLKAAAQSRS